MGERVKIEIMDTTLRDGEQTGWRLPRPVYRMVSLKL